MLPNDHFKSDGSCDCPFDGVCFECGKLCNDHDLVADYWWCSVCTNKSLDKYEEEQRAKITDKLDNSI